jgi:hypothetical protein
MLLPAGERAFVVAGRIGAAQPHPSQTRAPGRAIPAPVYEVEELWP